MRARRWSIWSRFVVVAVLAAAFVVAAPPVPGGADGNEAPGNPFAFRSISTGTNATCAIVHDATLKCWGNNTTGQLGLGNTTTRGAAPGDMGDALPAVNLGTGRSATAVSSGGGFNCALLDNATVKCWGSNVSGRLGLGDTANRGDAAGEMGDSLPAVNLGTGRTAVAVSTGNAHACAVLDNATVKCWGENNSGQLGLGDVAARGDAAGEMGDSLPTVSLGTGRTATRIAAGQSHTCALLDNATVKCWGFNGNGQSGLGDVAQRGDAAGEMGDSLPAVSLGTGRTVTALSATENHTCAVLDNATLKCWGSNGNGRLGLGDTANRGDAAGEMGDSLPAVGLGTGRTVAAVSAGGTHTCALLDNATVKCWGNGNSGRLGVGDTTNRGDAAGEMGDALPAVDLGTGRTAVAVTSSAQSCALLDNRAVKCWANNNFGQLGLGDVVTHGDNPGEMGDALLAVALGSSRTVTAVDAGANHACARLDNGQVRCWGSNQASRLGLGDAADRGDAGGEMGDALPPVSLGTGRTATTVTAGAFHNCARLDNATTKCWGSNGSGQLGLGDTATRGDSPGDMGDALPPLNLGTGRTATAITAGQAHTCALLDNGTVKCWGVNGGRLGLGDTANRGDAPGEMGNSLAAVDLGTGRTATAITAGTEHTCALLDNATVKCWGVNADGQLGLGDTATRGDAPGEMGDALPPVDLGAGRTATAVTAGTAHTCARLDNATVKCWGHNGGGRLGLGDSAKRGDAAGEMGDALPAVNLGTGRTATAVVAGGSHTCARLDNAKVRCWGDNLSGSLGLGDTANRGDAAGEMGDSLPTVALGAGRSAVALTGGASFTCAQLDNATVKCWGNNGGGRLGQGDTRSRGDTGGEMGDSLLPVDLGSGLATGISGTVVDAGSAAPVPGAFVAVLRTTDFSIAAGAVADALANYVVAVPPGSYFLYLVDPTGTHAAGFSGPPTLVTVPADTVVDADPTMVATRGSVTGTVTEAGPNTAIPGAWVIALSGTTGGPERAVIANGSGAYAVGGLRAGSHFIGYIDPAGNHATRFAPNAPNVPESTPVAVTAGGSTIANGSLPTQTTTGTGASLTGTVTEQGTGSPLANVFVFAMHAADFRLARAGVTNASGAYNLDVTAGSYKLVFLDSSGLHDMEWHNDQPFDGIANAASVTAPTDTNAALDRTTGSISGAVTDDPSFAPVAGAWVFAIGPTGINGGVVTAANGTYTITGLSPGTYRVTFVDPVGGRRQEFFDNAPDFGAATTVNVTAGANVNDLDGHVGLP